MCIRDRYESEVCYVPESGERAVIQNFTTEFSQLVDIETDSEDVICDVDIMMTNCYVDFHAYSQEAVSYTHLERGVNVTVRRRLGSDIDASCGQLRRKAIDRK